MPEPVATADSAHTMPEGSRRVVRHLLVAIAYRASRSLRDAPEGFADVQATDDSMAAGELVRHMTNVLAFAVASVTVTERIRHEPLGWDGEVRRFYDVLSTLDAQFASGVRLAAPDMDLTIIQGPLADVLTQIGQLNALRRKAGAPIAPESYIKADVRIGRVGLDEQPT